MEDVKIYTLFSGSSGNSCYVSCGDTEILIDAGKSMRATEEALSLLGTSLKNIKAIFVTHEHSDHIKGLKMISKYHRIPVYAARGTAEMLINDVPDSLINVYKAGDLLEIGNIKLLSFETPHDSRMSTGYIIEYNGRRFGYATDMGMLSRRIADMLAECEAAIVESNYDLDMLRNGPYPYVLKRRIESNTGHLDNCDCARLVSYLASHSTKRFLLAHLSAENNTPEVALKTVKEYLECKCLCADVSVADRCCPTRLI
ncbi:MAG: MBL fold metallo-hydrolase [Ruminococcaceae bacterium]|nr:MBL fold metallo-hydrolase [Oscillospiraceae bacterium]